MKKPKAEILSLCQELPLVMDRLHRSGLHETGHAMHEVVRKSGYEAARMLIQEHTAKSKKGER